MVIWNSGFKRSSHLPSSDSTETSKTDWSKFLSVRRLSRLSFISESEGFCEGRGREGEPELSLSSFVSETTGGRVRDG